ncbi:hypothetical protein M430DRAFT_34710 [Amorphotheca resinae ATCC 22711]|uniref:Amino acid permease/ SLC12A domain-containing protein n=1 Tax=Amorphotheca resinae ATCC 22711 TaxID=857342 RepID=A0A2T3B471_AMORE|nr:hypothetical protein M430DRAFT_34710 [Amorphotheca resinae ATCC 22711]PSS20430.1 hypothetical protein M430DRAFT_34710 [Amorphotheca resinae ATCC 22711]
MAFKDGELSVEESPVSPHRLTIAAGSTSQDQADMAGVGKKQRFTRNFGFISMLGFTTTMMCSWEAVFFSNSTAMSNGGSVTLVYGFIFCFFGSLATAASLAEMVSMFPTSGGQYHFVAMLAPKKYSVFLSWITGWVSTIGWNANSAAGVFFGATMIQGLLVLNDSNYGAPRWQGTLIMWAALLLVLIVNTVGAKILPKIEGFILIIHTLGFFAVLIPLVYLAPHGSAADVFKNFIDAGDTSGYSSGGLAFFVGIISTNLPFIGYDGPIHMAEEVVNASTIVPWSMICTILLNGTLGLAMVIAFCFCLGDLETALTSPTGYDFIEVFYNATNSTGGTSAMTAPLITLVICATFGFLASSSRQTWAFARDQGLPFSNFLSHVNTRTALPLNAVIFCATVTAIICIINIASTVAFNAIVSLTIAGLYTSYFIPITLLAIKRSREPSSIVWGPWTLGPAGLIINILSMCFLIISIVFSFFPPVVPVTLISMNWSALVFGGGVIIGLVFYAIWGRKNYHGPIFERGVMPTDQYGQ